MSIQHRSHDQPRVETTSNVFEKNRNLSSSLTTFDGHIKHAWQPVHTVKFVFETGLKQIWRNDLTFTFFNGILPLYTHE